LDFIAIVSHEERRSGQKEMSVHVSGLHCIASTELTAKASATHTLFRAICDEASIY
jgi:hypothetical protein